MNTLLITGVTGFLGGAVLENILNNENGINLLLLVRANNDEAALARVKENLRKFNIAEEKLAALTPADPARRFVITGDVPERPAPGAGHSRDQQRCRRLIW